MAATDFDFLLGTWDVEHDKMLDPFGSSPEQVRFHTRARVWSILDGLGTADETRGVLPGGEEFCGFSLRQTCRRTISV